MGKSSGNQTVTQKTELPSWYTGPAKEAIKFSQEAAKNISSPYMGNTVAGLDPLQQQAISLTGQNIGSTNQAFQQAGQTAANVAGYRPDSFLSGNMSAYMNPYIQNVENAALDNMNRAYKQNLNAIGDQAFNANAFGGSRQALAEGIAAAENARQMGDLSAQLRSQGYNDAAARWQQDQTNAYNAQGLNLQGATTQGNLASGMQQAYLQSINSALAAGQINQDQAQKYLDQAQSQYDAMRNVPLEQLNIMLSALGGTQVPTTSKTSQPTTGNSFLSALGGIGSILSGLGTAGIISDERMKTNIEPLGVDGMTGLPIYAYDYKSDVANAQATGEPMPPKRMGPMAQDVEQLYPDAVHEVNGKKVIDTSRIAPEGMEYMTTGTMPYGQGSLEHLLGWMMGLQDGPQYPTPAGGKTDRQTMNFGFGG